MRGFNRSWLAVTGLLALLLLYTGSSHIRLRGLPFAPFTSHSQHVSEHSATSLEVTLVVASQKHENTTWLNTAFRDWQKAVYVVDDPESVLASPFNKGRESSVYMTYIIDHYENLTDITIFSHAERFQWHNDDPLYDGLEVLSKLQLSYVQTQGYVSLRCVWTLGCPAEIHPFTEALAASDPSSKDARAGAFYKQAFEELFPGETVPETVGAPCCAQFAVTADRIRARPKSDYERYRDWLRDTPLRDGLSGRILEYSWHIIFGKEAVFCPNAQQCYCNLFGMCNLTCEEEGACRSVYTLPKYSTLPQGWPDIDWDGNWRNITEIRKKLPA